MRVRAATLMHWAAIAAAAYVAALGLWLACEPLYMQALALLVGAVDAINLLPTSVEAVVVQGRGLIVQGADFQPLAVPQRVVGAEVALTVALVIATAWLSWRQRARRLPLAICLVFAVHLAALLAQTWVSGVAPVLAWCAVVAPPLLVDIKPRLHPASAGHAR